MTTPVDLERVLEVATGAAVDAGELLLSSLGKIEHFERKSSRRDLVTEADLRSERLLVERLRAAFPTHAIEAEEETRDAPDDSRPRWFLDPLDGTVNYFHGIGLFAVSMGLWFEKKPIAAVVHVPRLEETFTARAGGGAWLNGQPIRVSETTELAEAVLATGFPYRRGELEHDNLANFSRVFYDVRGLRRMGSAALDLAYTACGRLDGFWELHLSPHDVAAGGLLVREAGGQVSDFGGGENWLRGGSLIAANPRLHRALSPYLEG